MKIKATIQGQKKYERFVYSTIHTLVASVERHPTNFQQCQTKAKKKDGNK